MFDGELFKKYELYFCTPQRDSFEIKDGESRVMISAPHAVEQLREGRIKYAEPQSGALALLMGKQLGVPVIYKTRNCDDDANYDKQSTYKDALCEYIRKNKISFLLDLHQLASSREMTVNLGTGRYKNVDKETVGMIAGIFEEQGLIPIGIDDPFGASNPYTVSSYVARHCGIPCLQIEINSRLLIDNIKETEKVFEALCQTVRAIETAFSQNEK